MDNWYPVRLAPRDGTPVTLWIEDPDAPPTYPVTAGVWETDDMTGRSHWRVFGLAMALTSTSTSTSSAGDLSLTSVMPDELAQRSTIGRAREVWQYRWTSRIRRAEMALIRDELIEAEARAMMRAAIEKSGWYPSLQGAARQRRIDQDIDLHWHLMVSKARERLEQGSGGKTLEAVAQTETPHRSRDYQENEF